MPFPTIIGNSMDDGDSDNGIKPVPSADEIQKQKAAASKRKKLKEQERDRQIKNAVDAGIKKGLADAKSKTSKPKGKDDDDSKKDDTDKKDGKDDVVSDDDDPGSSGDGD